MLLAGDIGGTKTVFALYDLHDGPHAAVHKSTFPSQEFDSLESVIETYLDKRTDRITHAAFGVAGPVVGGRAQITNLPWIIDRHNLARTFGLEDVHLLNDLEAVAASVPILREEDLVVLNQGAPHPRGAIGVIAPGTGLGEAFLVWDGARYRAFPCEGGHADFAPVGELQRELLAYLEGRLAHVSFERVCSGIGIPNLYDFLRDSGRHPEPAALARRLETVRDRTPVIVDEALKENTPLCTATVNLFIDILAREAGNLALKVLATGGIYLGGGIPPRIVPQLQGPRFMKAFTSKGRFAGLLSNIPIKVICRHDAALLGVAHDGLQMMRTTETSTPA